MERKTLPMTDEEFDVLDELYFVISYDALLSAVGLEDMQLREVLVSLEQKKWVKVLSDFDTEVQDGAFDIIKMAQDYYFLATKGGLQAHNSN